MKELLHPYAIYDTQEAAILLGVDSITIQRYIRAGKLIATRFGKVYRITGQALLDLMSLDQTSVQFVQDRVRIVENGHYVRSKSFLLTDLKGQKYVELFNLTSDALIASLNPEDAEKDEDQLTLRYIGSRILNTAMAAYRDALSGYYQVSIANQRDLIEIQFLTDYFRSFPLTIVEWSTAKGKDRKKFWPVELRKALDGRDNFNDRKREARYKQFSEFATHISYDGFKLLTNESNLVEVGPFLDEFKLINTMYDLSLNYGAVVISLQANLKIKSGRTATLWVKHMELFDKVFNFNLTEGEKFKEAKQSLNNAINVLKDMENRESDK